MCCVSPVICSVVCALGCVCFIVLCCLLCVVFYILCSVVCVLCCAPLRLLLTVLLLYACDCYMYAFRLLWLAGRFDGGSRRRRRHGGHAQVSHAVVPDQGAGETRVVRGLHQKGDSAIVNFSTTVVFRLCVCMSVWMCVSVLSERLQKDGTVCVWVGGLGGGGVSGCARAKFHLPVWYAGVSTWQTLKYLCLKPLCMKKNIRIYEIKSPLLSSSLFIFLLLSSPFFRARVACR